MPASVQYEYERKYDVAEDAVVPALPGGAEEHVAVTLSADYFDTRDLTLARRRIVVRRRTGGADAGWHIKAVDAAGERLERHWPLGDGAMPQELLDRVRVHVRSAELVAIARVVTVRTVHVVADAKKHPIAELCDDRVDATNLLDGSVRSWHEWEVELVQGANSSQRHREAALDALEEPLLEAGALPSGSASKLARALGRDGGTEDAAPAVPISGSSSAREALEAMLGALAHKLKAADPEVRTGDADAVHDMRTTVRRLRSVLMVFGRARERDAVARLGAELEELGRVLGAVRDPAVLHDRARYLARSQTNKPMHAQVLGRLVREKDEESRRARADLRTWLDSARYFALLDDLDALVTRDDGTEHGERPAKSEFARGLRRAYRQTRKAMKKVGHGHTDEQREQRLHDVRKAARKLRYAAEAVTEPPVELFGDRVARLGRRAKRLQESLGVHRDSILLQRALVQSASTAHESGIDTFGHGRLHAFEQLRGDTALASYSRAAERIVAAKRLLP